MSLSFTIGRDTITIFLDGSINTVKRSHANFLPLLAELKKPRDERDLDTIRSLSTIRRYIEAQTFGNVTIDNDAICYKGEPVHGYLAVRMMEILEQGVGIEPWAYFMDNLMENPSESARNELYEWLELARLPLTPDGCFIAFKQVRDDFTDLHSGQFDNSVGTFLEMDRDLCDTDRDRHCSTGFHWCSPGYLASRDNQPIMAVKVNPRDVTSIPSDYNLTKGRCCAYEVVAQLKNHDAMLSDAWTKKAVVDLEDTQEFPDLLIKPTTPPEKKTIVSKENKVASKPTPTKQDRVVKAKVVKVAKTVGEKEFRTTTGSVFTAKDILKTLKKHPSTREAARHLGVGESTLRGWKKVLGL